MIRGTGKRPGDGFPSLAVGMPVVVQKMHVLSCSEAQVAAPAFSAPLPHRSIKSNGTAPSSKYLVSLALFAGVLRGGNR